MRARSLLAVLAIMLCACGKLSAAASADQLLCADEAAQLDARSAACERHLSAVRGRPAEEADALYLRSLVRAAAGRPADAITDLDAAAKLAPEKAYVLMNRGVLHGMQGELDAALHDFDESIRLDPKQPVAYTNRALVREKRHEYELALADLSTAIELDPAESRSWGARCWIRAITNRELDQALADCEKSVRLKSSDWNTYNSRGFVLYRMGRFQEAIASYDTALRGDPKVASSWLVRGLAKRAAGDATGDADVAKGLAMDPTVADRYRGYGISVD